MMSHGMADANQSSLLRRRTQALFPKGCVVEVCPIDHACEQALIGEEHAIIESAADKRKNEFMAGRAVARAALSFLGIEGVPLLRGEGGEPLWPAGTVGSVSHADIWSMAVVGHQEQVLGLGLDIEVADRMSEAVARRILRDDELADQQADRVDLLHRAALLFSAKEAVYKALFPVAQQFIGFQEASIILKDPQSETIQFDVALFHQDTGVNQLAKQLSGVITQLERWIVAGVTLDAV